MDTSVSKRSYCRFCLSFCGIKINLNAQGVPQRILGDADHPVSRGYTCKKGRSLLEFYSRDRLLQPMQFGGTSLSWDQALVNLGKTIKDVVASHGPDAVALYAGTNATLDATGMWTALGFMYRLQSSNIYTVASIDAINKQVVLENITSYTALNLIPQIDFDQTDCLLLVGANPMVSHGHLAGMPYPGKRMRDILKRGGTVIVVDPRTTKTAKRASLHISPIPGSDYAWLAFVIRELLIDPAGIGVDHDYLDNHAIGLAELKATCAYFDEARTAKITGLDPQRLRELLAVIKKSENFSAVTGTGVSFSDAGIVTEWFLWALLVIKGKLDRPGGVWFNRGLTSAAAPTKSTDPTSRKTAWSLRMPARPDLPTKSGERTCAGMADEIIAKNIRVLICLGGNPLNAFPNRAKTVAALASLDALVVLDTHHNDLVDLAHYGLPVCGQLERADSTIYAQHSAPTMSVLFTNKVLESVGDVKPAWWVFSKLGEELGLDTVKLGKSTEQLDDIEVLKTIKGGRELFDDSNLLAAGFVVVREKQIGWVIDTVLPDKKWRLYTSTLATELRRVLAQHYDSAAVYHLVSMREDNHLNTQFMQERVADELPQARINKIDAQTHDLVDGQEIQLRSEHGVMLARVKISDEVRINTVCVPHGYRAQGNVSCLTSEIDNINPLSGMVTQTAILVQIEKVTPSKIRK
ncbi:molybdopterin-containing oxidoreductase family protein [Thiobacillus sp.]